MFIGTRNGTGLMTARSSPWLAQALADARLPDDFRCPGPVDTSRREILVTGGTGFFGRHLIATLLARPDSRLHLLIRASSDDQALERAQRVLSSVGFDLRELGARVGVIRGSISLPRFGLSDNKYDALAERIDLVLHGAAEVNWTWSYRRLREVNVGGTVEALRFAFHRRAKQFGFISTIAAGFVGDGPPVVNETTSMLPYLAQMPLGYAQTKCVSETLLEQAADRGLPVTVARASLLMGDTHSGAGARNDLTAALLEACVRNQSALDIDWLFEGIPVDYAARAFLGLTLANRGQFERYQLRAYRPRHWREIVLWLNLAGYLVDMEAVDSWLDRQFGRQDSMIERLLPFRRFFLGAPGTSVGMRPFEIFLRAQRRLDCSLSHRRLGELGIVEPSLGADYLERCVNHFRDAEILPVPRRSPRRKSATGCFNDTIEQGLRLSLAAPELRVLDCQLQPLDSSGGFMTELTAARCGGEFGVRRLGLTLRRRPGSACENVDMVVKTKPRDVVMQRIMQEVANFCDARLGSLFEQFPRLPGFARMQQRERMIGTLKVPPLTRHTPRCYAAWSHPGGHAWSLATEFLGEFKWDGNGTSWSFPQIELAIDVLANLHSWSMGQKQLQGARWLPDPISAAIALQMKPLWLALAEFSDQVLSANRTSPIGAYLERLIDGIETWWPVLDAMPQALVHNDVNPRNFAWYKTAREDQLKLFDWELARWGAPQSDTVELLCYVLPQNVNGQDFYGLLERHRVQLGMVNGKWIEPEIWLVGAKLALYRFGVERLPLYALAHRIRPQPFIERLAQNWLHLCTLFTEPFAANDRPGLIRYLPMSSSGSMRLMPAGKAR